MSRHKALKGIIADSYYEDDYGDEDDMPKKSYDDDYGDEGGVPAPKKKKAPKKSKLQHGLISSHYAT
jgi:hypothetical protein